VSCRVSVTVKPGAKCPGIGVAGETIVVRVRERAIDGAANAACIRALAEALGIAPSSVEILRGHTNRQKLIAVTGLSADQVFQFLQS
jgi:uncharacterized protein YggU (UPF0235/DUF167 family)